MPRLPRQPFTRPGKLLALLRWAGAIPSADFVAKSRCEAPFLSFPYATIPPAALALKPHLMQLCSQCRPIWVFTLVLPESAPALHSWCEHSTFTCR